MPRYAILLFSPIDAITPLRHYAITAAWLSRFSPFRFSLSINYFTIDASADAMLRRCHYFQADATLSCRHIFALAADIFAISIRRLLTFSLHFIMLSIISLISFRRHFSAS
jgi:hypothetical protein